MFLSLNVIEYVTTQQSITCSYIQLAVCIYYLSNQSVIDNNANSISVIPFNLYPLYTTHNEFHCIASSSVLLYFHGIGNNKFPDKGLLHNTLYMEPNRLTSVISIVFQFTSQNLNCFDLQGDC